jgi:hypothetical protein
MNEFDLFCKKLKELSGDLHRLEANLERKAANCHTGHVALRMYYRELLSKDGLARSY